MSLKFRFCYTVKTICDRECDRCLIWPVIILQIMVPFSDPVKHGRQKDGLLQIHITGILKFFCFCFC